MGSSLIEQPDLAVSFGGMQMDFVSSYKTVAQNSYLPEIGWVDKVSIISLNFVNCSGDLRGDGT